MKTIEFTKDFATKKKGDIVEYDSQLANNLVNRQKVAKYYKKPVKKKTEK